MLEIVGDSHIIAMTDAMRSEEFSSRHGPVRAGQMGHGYNFLEPFFTIDENGVSFTQAPAKAVFQQLNPDFPQWIQRNDPRRFVFVFGLYPSFGFNTSNWSAHTALPGPQERQFVSAGAFNCIIDETLKAPLLFFRLLKTMNVKFSVASCCPVPASYQKLAEKTVFAEHEVAFIYNRFRDRATEHLNGMGVFCHHPPSEVYNDHGEMLDIYVKQPGDYHANPEYGRLMLSKILREVDALD